MITLADINYMLRYGYRPIPFRLYDDLSNLDKRRLNEGRCPAGGLLRLNRKLLQ